jgi:hypothetical protein
LQEIVLASISLPLLEVGMPAKTIRLDTDLLLRPREIEANVRAIRAGHRVLALGRLEAVPHEEALDLYF